MHQHRIQCIFPSASHQSAITPNSDTINHRNHLQICSIICRSAQPAPPVRICSRLHPPSPSRPAPLSMHINDDAACRTPQPRALHVAFFFLTPHPTTPRAPPPPAEIALRAPQLLRAHCRCRAARRGFISRQLAPVPACAAPDGAAARDSGRQRGGCAGYRRVHVRALRSSPRDQARDRRPCWSGRVSEVFPPSLRSGPHLHLCGPPPPRCRRPRWTSRGGAQTCPMRRRRWVSWLTNRGVIRRAERGPRPRPRIAASVDRYR